MNAAPTTPLTGPVRTADLLPRFPSLDPLPAVHKAHPILSNLLLSLSLRGWPTGTDYASITEDDDAGEAGCAFCGWAYAPHERGDHRFCGRHVRLVEVVRA